MSELKTTAEMGSAEGEKLGLLVLTFLGYCALLLPLAGLSPLIAEVARI